MRTSKIYNKIANEGPLTNHDIDPSLITYEAKRDGVHKFILSQNPQGSSKAIGGQQTIVYYIKGKHSPRGVVEAWAEANQQQLETAGEWSIHQKMSRHGQAFKEASAEVLGPFHHQDISSDAGGNTTIETCPLCEAEVTKSLANHLPCDQ